MWSLTRTKLPAILSELSLKRDIGRTCSSFSKAPPQSAHYASRPADGILDERHRNPAIPPASDSPGAIRRYSTLTRNAPKFTYEKLLLPHHPLDDEDHRTLRAVLGDKAYEKIRDSRHREGLCHADTTIKMIEAAGKKADPKICRLMDWVDRKKTPVAANLGGALNCCLPLVESIRKNSRPYTKEELLQHGVPKDCIAVTVHAHFGVIDPYSEQAQSAKRILDSVGELIGGSHAIAVLHVDPEKQEILCCDLDPFRKHENGTNKDPFFKVDMQTFEQRVTPKVINGVFAVFNEQENAK